MEWICENCPNNDKPIEYCIWACGKEEEKRKEGFRMIDLTKLYYLVHPCTTGIKPTEQNQVDEKLVYYQLRSRHPEIKLIRPMDLLPIDLDHPVAMEKCLKLLSACDAAIFAGAWMTSKGCMMEFEFCKENEKGIIDFSNLVFDERCG